MLASARVSDKMILNNLFQGEKIYDHVIFIFKVPTFLYFFNDDWARSQLFYFTTFTLLQSYNNVNCNSVMLWYKIIIMIERDNI